MGWRLPPLNGLRAFEAAGRCKSFTLAADELHVTPGAISRQIKSLEETLGVALFERGNREVRLTAESEDYLEGITEAFRRIEQEFEPVPPSGTSLAKNSRWFRLSQLTDNASRLHAAIHG